MPIEFVGKSRVKPRVGDVFSCLFSDGCYVFGRVILNDAKAFDPSPDLNLLYFYATRSTEKTSEVDFGTSNLLIDPVITNNQLWLQGYAETVGNVPPDPDDVLERHRFRVGTGVQDEYAQAVESDEGPIYRGGLWSFGAIAKRIDEVLGLT